MLKFISFRSGSSGNCYLLKSDSTAVMLDSGVGERNLNKYFHDYGLSFADVSAVLVTHDHADHIKSVGKISGKHGMPVYATQKVHAGIQKNYCVRKKVSPENMVTIEKSKTFSIGDFAVTAFEVPHDSSENVGYMIERGGVTFCLVTDVGHVTESLRENICRSNYLVIESNYDNAMLDAGPYPLYLKRRISGPDGHLDNGTCAKTLCECYNSGMRHVWLCHLSEENNHPELARKTVEEEFQKHGVKVGSDILLDVLNRKSPTGFFDLE